MHAKVSVKEKWEIVWIIFQIFALLIAAWWSYSRWGFKDKAELMPRFSTVINDVKSSWHNEDSKNACQFTTAWFLNNKGLTPIEVKDIKVEVFALPDIFEKPQNKNIINLSSGARIIGKEPVISESLTPNFDDVSGGGTTSRSISFVYFPDEPADWFSKNQFVLKVSASVAKPGLENRVPSITTSTQYICHVPSQAVNKSSKRDAAGGAPS